MADADFNSSDMEFEAPPPGHFTLPGAHSVDSILNNASALRIESKKAVEQLQSVNGAPSTRMQRARWANAWEAFYSKVLKKSDDSTPTGQDVERFLLSIPQMTQTSYSSRESLSWSTFQLALEHTIHAIRCKHDSFALTYNDRHRLRSCFETLRSQNRITTEPARDAQWLTTRLMTHLNRALLTRAIQFGVTDWSVVVQKCLGLALQSALSSRSGDVAVSRYYEDKECLVYKDIQLKVAVDTTIPSEFPLVDRVYFDAKITLRHTKGKKRDASRNHIVALTSLDDVEFNVVDPLKLLLAHALRHDSVASANTISDAVQQALAHHDRLILWKYPDRPVLCALAARKFDYNKGAGTQQLLETLNEAARLSGISQRLVTHDIRRGAAVEAAQLQPHLNIELAAQALGHTNSTRERGVTAKYVGHDPRSRLADRLNIEPSDNFDLTAADTRVETMQKPHLNMKVAAQALDHTNSTRENGITAKYVGHGTGSRLVDRLNIEPSDSFGLTAVDTRVGTMQKKRKVSSAEIDEFLGRPENAQLKKMKAPRHAATRAINKQKSESLAYQLQAASAPVGSDAVQTKRKDGKPLEQWKQSKMNIRTGQPATLASAEGFGDENEVSEEATRLTSKIKASACPAGHEAVKPNIDPALLFLSGYSPDIPQGLSTEVSSMLPNISNLETVLDDMTLDEEVHPGPSSIVTAAQQEIQVLEAPASSFVVWLSQINTRVVNDSNPAQHSNLDHLRGGSRDDPTFFLHHCQYESQGCTFATISGPSLKFHQATCTPERRQDQAAQGSGPSQACDISGCKYVARAETIDQMIRKMKRHKTEEHTESATKILCPIGGRPTCAGPFKNTTALSRHKARDHSDIVPQRCPVEGCTSTTLFDTAPKLEDHVRKTHLLKGKELGNIVKAAKAVQKTD